MRTPDETTVWIGLDIGKTEHFADVLDEAGAPLFAGAVANDEAAIEALIARAESFGSPALVVDQPGSLARLVLGVAARRGVPVAYVPGLVMRRAADLYPGESKTDRRDAFVLADTGRTRRHQVHWLDAGNDELLEQLRVLNGYDTDLAADATRLSNRLRDALTSVSPALERVLGPKLHNAGARDLLARYPTPQALATAGRGRIARTLRKRSPRLAAALTEAVTEALDAQTVVVPGSVAMGRVIAEVATELDRTQQRRERLGAEIGELFEAHPFGLILGSLPGVGPRTGARMLAEIGDISRFANGSRLLRRPCPGHPPVRQQHPGADPEPPRQSPAQERDVPLRLRLAARPRLAGVLRPQASRGKETHRSRHLPRASSLRRHPGHAALARTVPHRGGSSSRVGGCLTPRRPSRISGACP